MCIDCEKQSPDGRGEAECTVWSCQETFSRMNISVAFFMFEVGNVFSLFRSKCGVNFHLFTARVTLVFKVSVIMDVGCNLSCACIIDGVPHSQHY